jgi:hypothetical protein
VSTDEDADAFWTRQAGNQRGAVVIGHLHYRVRPDLNGRPGIAGFDRALFRIRMLATGEVINTRNLTFQGEISPQWGTVSRTMRCLCRTAQDSSRLTSVRTHGYAGSARKRKPVKAEGPGRGNGRAFLP